VTHLFLKLQHLLLYPQASIEGKPRFEASFYSRKIFKTCLSPKEKVAAQEEGEGVEKRGLLSNFSED
jgi:hypothetical protein